MSRLTLGGLLIVVWVLLWGALTPANVLGGAAVAVVLFAAYPSDLPRWPRRRPRPLALAVLAWHVVLGVVRSNVLLTLAVLGPARKVRTELVRVELRTADPRLVTAVTNLTALTPGAMVVGIDPAGDRPQVLLHVMGIRQPKQFATAMLQLERRCVRALGTDEQIAALDRPDSPEAPHQREARP